jgi:hypothetical protein
VDLVVDHVVGDKLGLEEGEGRLHEHLMRFHYYYYCDPGKGGLWRKTPR